MRIANICTPLSGDEVCGARVRLALIIVCLSVHLPRTETASLLLFSTTLCLVSESLCRTFSWYEQACVSPGSLPVVRPERTRCPSASSSATPLCAYSLWLEPDNTRPYRRGLRPSKRSRVSSETGRLPPGWNCGHHRAEGCTLCALSIT